MGAIKMSQSAFPAIIEARSVKTMFGDHLVHQDISFAIDSGTVVALIGGSGSGKSTLLREIIGLLPPTSGSTHLFGADVWGSSSEELFELKKRFGVLFQNGALFSALTVGENVAVPLVENSRLSSKHVAEVVQLRLGLSGLSADTAMKMPSELSGGMRKRVALARALALEPEILFLDEPTSGLDPINARAFDHLIKTLSRSLGLTVFMVTHDLDSISLIADRVIVLGQGRVIADGSLAEVIQSKDPWITEYFSSRS
jgi:phospholipid/cholesterol/gamma-HCH transport system ATP-binding protein